MGQTMYWDTNQVSAILKRWKSYKVSDIHEIELETDRRKITGKISNVLKLNKTIL